MKLSKSSFSQSQFSVVFDFYFRDDRHFSLWIILYSRKTFTSILTFTSSSNDVTQLDSEIIIIVFAFDSLRSSQHSHVSELFDEVIRTVQIIVVINLRSAVVRRQQKERSTRNSSIESLFYSTKWAIDKSIFRKAFKQFIKQTIQYRQSQVYRNLQSISRDQSSLLEANSLSSHSPSNSITSKRQIRQSFVAFRIVSRFLFENIIDDSSIKQARVRLSRVSSFFSLIDEKSDSISTKHRFIRATTEISAEKVIYNRFLESEQQMKSMFILFDEDIQRIVDRVITNYVQQNSSQSDSSDVSNDRDSSDLNELNDMNADTSRFQSKKLSFFNLIY